MVFSFESTLGVNWRGVAAVGPALAIIAPNAGLECDAIVDAECRRKAAQTRAADAREL